MSNRITERDLEHMVTLLNNTPSAADGTYQLAAAYGRWSLNQTIGTKTAVRQVFGYGTKRELFSQMSTVLVGMYAANKEN